MPSVSVVPIAIAFQFKALHDKKRTQPPKKNLDMSTIYIAKLYGGTYCYILFVVLILYTGQCPVGIAHNFKDRIFDGDIKYTVTLLDTEIVDV